MISEKIPVGPTFDKFTIVSYWSFYSSFMMIGKNEELLIKKLLIIKLKMGSTRITLTDLRRKIYAIHYEP